MTNLKYINPTIFERKLSFLFNRIFTRFLFKKCGKKLKLEKSYFLTPESIEIYDNVLICKGARIEGVKNYEGVKFSPKIIIEDNVSIQQNVHLTCANLVHIKKNTAIAANVSITDIIHPFEDITLPIEKQKIRYKQVTIGEGCKIYNNAVILPGVNLGRHCVIGANSVVLEGLYPDFCILVGVPAKIIKKYCFITNQWVRNGDN